MSHSALSPIEKVGFELSAQQKRLWRCARGESSSTVAVIRIDGDVDVTRLKNAVDRILNRHEAFRATLHADSLRRYPLQVVGTEPRISWTITTDNSQNGTAPSPKLLLLELNGLFSDFATLQNICRELAREYGDISPEAPVQYVDYAGWQEMLLDQGEGQGEAAEALAYWHTRDRRSFSTQLLRTDAVRRTYTGPSASLEREAESSLENDLEAVCKELGVSERSFLLAAWFVLLWRLSGEPPVVGVEFDGRTFAELERAVGLFARWLSMSVNLDGATTIKQVIDEVALHEEKSRRWQDYFNLDNTRDDANNFVAGFEFRDLRPSYRSNEAVFSLVDYDLSYEPCELKLVCTMRQADLSWNIHFASGLFDIADRRRISECFAQLIRSAASNPTQRLDELQLLSPALIRRVVGDWNQTTSDFPKYQTVLELFDSVVAHDPHKLALKFDERCWTFVELNRRANRLAHYLKRSGAAPEVVVGLCLEHSDDLIIAALAVWKSGAAFVPLNPALPPDRLNSLAKKSAASLVVSTADLGRIFQVTVIDVNAPEIIDESDDNPICDARLENLAYVMYTSGSTGGPKGVMIEHRSLLNLAFALDEAIYSRPTRVDSVSLNGPLSFDTSIKQLVQLCFGRTLCVVPPKLRNVPAELLGFLSRNEVDAFDCTPSQLRVLIDAELLASKERRPSMVLVGGEEFDNQTWLNVAQSDTQFVNLYGPTECTVDTTCAHVTAESVPTLGKPLANIRAYILDEKGRPVPPGVIGELHVTGTGVGRGYFQQPDLTAEYFIPDSFSEITGARLYRTGDFARHLANGEIEYRGRRDDQVKIRGSRVELNEVAEVLSEHPALDQVVVLPQTSSGGEKRLVAYVVLRRGARVGASELRRFVLARLPDFMTPARFFEVKSIPLTTGGKVDRQLLASLQDSALSEGVVQDPPRTLTEQTTAAIWREVLEQALVGRDSNFFELGGYSLRALRAIARLRQAFDVQLPVRALFDHPTLAALSTAIDQMRGATNTAEPRLRRIQFQDAGRPLSPAQEGLWLLSQLNPGDVSYNMVIAVRLQGELQLPLLQRSIETIIQRHETLRAAFHQEGGVPRALISDNGAADLQTIELSTLEPELARKRVYDLALAEARVPFELRNGLLYRVRLVKLAPADHVLLFITHHIVFDGPSAQIFLNELARHYDGGALPELSLSYSDYAHWQLEQPRNTDFQRRLDYWREQLRGVSTDLSWPGQQSASARTRLEQAFEQYELSGDLTRQLREACRREQVTPYIVFLTAYLASIHRWSGHADLVVTSPYAARTHTEIEPLIGYFINNLVLRVRIPEDGSYASLLHAVKEVVVGAMANHDLPLGKLLEAVGIKSKNGQTPFDRLRFDLQEQGVRSHYLPGLTMSLESADEFMVRYDLFLLVRESEEQYSISLGYDAALFRRATIAELLNNFLGVLKQLVEQPQSKIREKSISGLLKIKPKLVRLPDSAELVAETLLDPQKPGPLVLETRHPQTKLVKWFDTNREQIGEKLLRHGGILFRNFDLDGIAEFEKFVAAFDQELIAYHERSTPRTRIQGNVYTSTEYSADQTIQLHSESSYAHCWPMKIWFYCVEPAASGGRTLTADNREVSKRIAPEVRERMTKTSVMYVRNYHPRIDLPWTEVFQTTDRSEVEAYCRANSIGYRWLDGDRLQTMQVRQAVAQHPRTKEWVWFNQSHLFHINNLPSAIREVLQQSLPESEWPRNSYHGDGTPIDTETLEQIADAYRRCAVPIDWRKGDVLMLDNMLASHGREPFTGNRKIAVAMAEPYSLSI